MADGKDETVAASKPEVFYNYRDRIKCSPEEEAQLERQHFWNVINAFKYYRIHVHERVNRAERQFQCLPDHHQQILTNFLPNLSKIRYCVDRNQEVLQAIVNNCLDMFENMEYGQDGEPRKVRPSSTFDMDKLKSTIKQFVRDWSEAGKAERDSCYKPIIEEIQRLFPPEQCDVSQVRVLVPGSGLGRLAWEIARLGYSCQGNEWSFFMLFSSNFVLNRCDEENALTLYPWIHQFSNNKMSSDQTRPVSFPDVNPQSLPADSDFSMVAGDFQEVYSEPEMWDCVATCFFIDTAHNVLDYIETIWTILKPGGVWINLGPLLYHYENMANQQAVQEGRGVVPCGLNISAEQLNLLQASLRCNMSAMHWEARRRQQVLDRRLSASVKQEEKQGKKKEHSEAHMTPCEPAGSREALEVDEQCSCKCHAKTKRYTSLQYSQQW